MLDDRSTTELAYLPMTTVTMATTLPSNNVPFLILHRSLLRVPSPSRRSARTCRCRARYGLHLSHLVYQGSSCPTLSTRAAVHYEPRLRACSDSGAHGHLCVAICPAARRFPTRRRCVGQDRCPRVARPRDPRHHQDCGVQLCV